MVEQLASHQAEQQRASAVIAVTLRVAGPVLTEVHPHAIGTREQQVCVRLGDALVYLFDRRVAARIRQQWDAAQYLALRLPERAPQAWLQHAPGSYPLGVCLRLGRTVEVTSRHVPARASTRTPPHVRLRVDRLVWQLCDRQSWRAIGDAWLTAAQHLTP